MDSGHLGGDGRDRGMSEDSFNILLATDIHLGFAERDPIRGNDSFITFKEILDIGLREEVDFILLGGDLFHENKPSRQCLQKCMDILRQYVFGPKPIEFEFLSDPEEIFKTAAVKTVNYEDENLNIGMPIFSIHGNHDDPAGLGQFCSLDLLSTAALVNYFGKIESLKEIHVRPLLFRKGEISLALFGLSAIKDDRLHRLFSESKVTFMRPQEDKESWFNLLVLHQNRVAHGPKNHIPESFLPKFMNLVFWGHEHECLVKEEYNQLQDFYVSQPGSSVATSLVPGEMKQKAVGILRLHKNKVFEIEEVPLKTVRPLIIGNLSVTGLSEDTSEEEISDLIAEEINNLIEMSKNKVTGHPDQPTLPLVRLNIEYELESQMISTTLFGRRFQDLVANPSDILKFKKVLPGKQSKEGILDADALEDAFQNASLNERVESLVEDYFKNSEKPLHLLSERGLSEAVRLFTDKEDKDALEKIVEIQMKKTMDYLKKNSTYIEEGSFDDLKSNTDAFLEQFKCERKEKKKDEEDIAELKKELETPKRHRGARTVQDENEEDDDVNFVPTSAARAKLRGRGRGRGETKTRSPKGKARGGGRVTAPVIELEDDVRIEDVDMDETIPPSPPPGRGGRSVGAKRGRTTQSSIKEALSRQSSLPRSSGTTQRRGYNYEDSD
ncbi:double-strand break repair protein MRE11-like isoform X2 [Artemia franciscana]|nr:hypothetical protein QYM36_011928 [Artemia franciscana]KAK2710566.1 hypothetical protein QYM36_011928 [Artemia franciscana]